MAASTFGPHVWLKRFLPSDEPMWVKLRESEAALRLLAGSARPESQAISRECEKLLEEAKECLARKPRWSTRHSLWFWRLMHRFDENLILIVPDAHLAAEALYITEIFRRNVTDPVTKEVWEPRLLQAVDELHPPPSLPALGEAAKRDGEATERAPPRASDVSRQVLRRLLHILNEQTDRGFRSFAMDGMIQLLSAGLLAVIFLIGLAIYGQPHSVGPSFIQPFALPTGAVLLLGAAGAIISNMISPKSFLVPTGQTVGAALFYLIVIPTIGAASALLTLALERTELLFTIVAPAANTAEPGGALPAIRAPLAIAVGHELLGLAVLAVAAGFFGHRVLRSTLGKLRERIWGSAEKATMTEDAGLDETRLRAETWT